MRARICRRRARTTTRGLRLGRENWGWLNWRKHRRQKAGRYPVTKRISRYLEVAVEDIGRVSLEATDPQPISSVCAVLAESEIINHVSEGRTVPDIIRGAHESLAERALSQLRMIGYDGAVVCIGGVALQEGMIQACRAKFGDQVLVPDYPSHVVAYGAAILGLQRYQKRASAASQA